MQLKFHSRVPAGGTRQSDNVYHVGNKGTNYESCVNEFSPGQSIRSTGISSNTTEDIYTGTSQATPLVSGAAAIYWNRNRKAGLQLKDSVIYVLWHCLQEDEHQTVPCVH